jgi:hypothetical protein
MFLALHIITALSSVALSTMVYFRPVDSLFKYAYFSAAATLATGVAIVVMTRASLLRACFTGIVYLLAIGFMLQLASRRCITKDELDV